MGTCLFCGANGTMSREHVYRQAWRDLLHVEKHQLHRFGWRINETGEAQAWSKAWSGRPFDSRLKDVCTNCNNGWMSDLELAVEPVLVPLVLGEAVALSVDETRLLERWIAKTAIVLASLSNAKSTFKLGQAQELRSGQLPWGFHVWALGLPFGDVIHDRVTPFGPALAASETRIPPPTHGFTSFTFLRMHFFTAHTSDEQLAETFNFQFVLGRNVDSRNEVWTCPPDPRSVRPDMYPDIHTGVLREWFEICRQAGSPVRRVPIPPPTA